MWCLDRDRHLQQLWPCIVEVHDVRERRVILWRDQSNLVHHPALDAVVDLDSQLAGPDALGVELEREVVRARQLAAHARTQQRGTRFELTVDAEHPDVAGRDWPLRETPAACGVKHGARGHDTEQPADHQDPPTGRGWFGVIHCGKIYTVGDSGVPIVGRVVLQRPEMTATSVWARRLLSYRTAPRFVLTRLLSLSKLNSISIDAESNGALCLPPSKLVMLDVMLRRLPLAALVLGLGVLVQPAYAQDEPPPPEVRGVKIVVPTALGKASWGAQRLTRTLRKEIEAGTGGLVSASKLTKAQRKLGFRGSSRNSEKNLARAGQAAGADYVLLVDISKKGWVYTAHAVLINTETGALDMDFRSGFYKPEKEASDRGERISKTTLGKIAKLIGMGQLPASMKTKTAPATDPLAERLDDPPSRNDVKDPLSERIDDPPPRKEMKDPLAERLDDPPPRKEVKDPPRRDDPPPRRDDPPPTTASAMSATDTTSAPPSSSAPPEATASPTGADGEASVVAAAPSDGDSDILRARVSAGSGLLHTYDLSSDRVAQSGLSYRLSPMALFAAEVEGVVPGIGVGGFARVLFSPVEFDVTVDGQGVAQPKGSLLDLGFGVNLHLAISGSGRSAYEVIPMAGLRITSLGVARHPANIVLSSSSITPFVGVGVHLPLTEQLDVGLAFDGGFVVAYSEKPDMTGPGGSGGGFQLGGGLAARFWLSEYIGLAIDTRFDLQSVGLKGTPNRALPPDENLTDATVATKDLRTSIGVAFRI